MHIIGFFEKISELSPLSLRGLCVISGWPDDSWCSETSELGHRPWDFKGVSSFYQQRKQPTYIKTSTTHVHLCMHTHTYAPINDCLIVIPSKCASVPVCKSTMFWQKPRPEPRKSMQTSALPSQKSNIIYGQVGQKPVPTDLFVHDPIMLW